MIINLIYHNNAPYTVTQVNVGVNKFFEIFYSFVAINLLIPIRKFYLFLRPTTMLPRSVRRRHLQLSEQELYHEHLTGFETSLSSPLKNAGT